MAEFNSALSHTLTQEGKYSNIPSDPGGETYKGISRKNFPQWGGWASIDQFKAQSGFPNNADASVGLQVLVSQFYEVEFWQGAYAQIKDQNVAMYLFDCGVNDGKETSVMIMQQALKFFFSGPIVIDGKFGPKTLEFVNECDSILLLQEFKAQWALHYVRDVIAHPEKMIELHGWLRRVLA